MEVKSQLVRLFMASTLATGLGACSTLKVCSHNDTTRYTLKKPINVDGEQVELSYYEARLKSSHGRNTKPDVCFLTETYKDHDGQWVLFKDYKCDGKVDAYVNITKDEHFVAFRWNFEKDFEQKVDPVFKKMKDLVKDDEGGLIEILQNTISGFFRGEDEK